MTSKIFFCCNEPSHNFPFWWLAPPDHVFIWTPPASYPVWTSCMKGYPPSSLLGFELELTRASVPAATAAATFLKGFCLSLLLSLSLSLFLWQWSPADDLPLLEGVSYHEWALGRANHDWKDKKISIYTRPRWKFAPSHMVSGSPLQFWHPTFFWHGLRYQAHIWCGESTDKKVFLGVYNLGFGIQMALRRLMQVTKIKKMLFFFTSGKSHGLFDCIV